MTVRGLCCAIRQTRLGHTFAHACASDLQGVAQVLKELRLTSHPISSSTHTISNQSGVTVNTHTHAPGRASDVTTDTAPSEGLTAACPGRYVSRVAPRVIAALRSTLGAASARDSSAAGAAGRGTKHTAAAARKGGWHSIPWGCPGAHIYQPCTTGPPTTTATH